MPRTLQQARDFESNAQDPYHVLCAVSLPTGMRPREYLALKWPDVSFQQGYGLGIARTPELDLAAVAGAMQIRNARAAVV